MNSEKKILFVITQGERGGAQQYVYDVATHLPPEFSVTVAIGEPTGGRELHDKFARHNADPNAQKITVVQLQHLVRRISLGHDLVAIFELAELYRTIKPDIVHLNSSKAGVLGAAAKIAAHLSPAPLFVYTAHGWVFNEMQALWQLEVYRFLESWSTKRFDKVIVLSQREKTQAIDKLQMPEHKLSVIAHGRSLERTPLPQAEARQQILSHVPGAAPQGARWVGTLANYYYTKGLDILINAVAEAGPAASVFSFFLVGEGPERPKLERLIKEKNLSNRVFLTGSITAAAHLLPAFDLCILPSRKEGLPYALLEARTVGVPIIATDVGGVGELVEHNKNGFLVKPNSPSELSHAIQYAATHGDDLTALARTAPSPRTLSEMLADTTSLYWSLEAPQ